MALYLFLCFLGPHPNSFTLWVMVMSVKVPTHEMYRTLMLEIKIRLIRTEIVLQSKQPVTGLSSLDAEFCFLQVRKIIELITFSAALRDEDRYKRLRELQKVENPRDHGDHGDAHQPGGRSRSGEGPPAGGVDHGEATD